MSFTWTQDSISLESVREFILEDFKQTFKMQEILDLDEGSTELNIICRTCGRKDSGSTNLSICDMLQILLQHRRCRTTTRFFCVSDSLYLLNLASGRHFLYCDLCQTTEGFFHNLAVSSSAIRHKCKPPVFYFDGLKEARFLPTGFWELKFPFNSRVWPQLQREATRNAQRDTWILTEKTFYRLQAALQVWGVRIFPKPKARPQSSALINSSKARAAIDIFSLMTPEIEKGILRLFAKQYHSDTGHGNEEKMKQFNAAWTVITKKGS